MIHIIPQEDRNQALRMRRFLMAFASYLMWMLIALYCFYLGMLGTMQQTLWVFAMIIAMNLILYGVFRTGLNLRFKDPSLTMIQMILATVWVMTMAYFLDEGRGIMLLLYMVVFIFGMFRLNFRQFLVLTVIALMGYGFVILLLLINHSQSINLKIELLYLAVLFTVLIWLSSIGSYINVLRKKLSKANSELNNAIELIKQQAIHDDLTGVYNRGHLFHILLREKNLADRGEYTFSLCIFDLDDFKKVNDTYGHLAGDVVLKTLTQRIKDNIRQEDYIARYGGEEFVLVFAYPDLYDAMTCANRIKKLTSETCFPGLPDDFRITISMGLTHYQPGENIDTILKRADNALYRAKRAGKNRIEWEPAQDKHMVAKHDSAA
jgi:diguanylate cyclase